VFQTVFSHEFCHSPFLIIFVCNSTRKFFFFGRFFLFRITNVSRVVLFILGFSCSFVFACITCGSFVSVVILVS